LEEAVPREAVVVARHRAAGVWRSPPQSRRRRRTEAGDERGGRDLGGTAVEEAGPPVSTAAMGRRARAGGCRGAGERESWRAGTRKRAAVGPPASCYAREREREMDGGRSDKRERDGWMEGVGAREREMDGGRSDKEKKRREKERKRKKRKIKRKRKKKKI